MQDNFGKLMWVKYGTAYRHYVSGMKYQPNQTISGDASLCSNVRMRCPKDCVRTRHDVTDMSAIRASAAQFIDRFGEHAFDQARQRADELLAARNFPSRTRWLLISREIESLNISSVN